MAPRGSIDPRLITGELKVGDRTVASDYVAELKQEAARLKAELATYAQSSGQNSLAAIGQYIASTDPEQRDLLVSKMTRGAEAAAELVNYVFWLLDSHEVAARARASINRSPWSGASWYDRRWQIVALERELEASRRHGRSAEPLPQRRFFFF